MGVFGHLKEGAGQVDSGILALLDECAIDGLSDVTTALLSLLHIQFDPEHGEAACNSKSATHGAIVVELPKLLESLTTILKHNVYSDDWLVMNMLQYVGGIPYTAPPSHRPMAPPSRHPTTPPTHRPTTITRYGLMVKMMQFFAEYSDTITTRASEQRKANAATAAVSAHNSSMISITAANVGADADGDADGEEQDAIGLVDMFFEMGLVLLNEKALDLTSNDMTDQKLDFIQNVGKYGDMREDTVKVLLICWQALSPASHIQLIDRMIKVRDATPRHVMPRHAMSRHATPCHPMSRYATPRYATPRYATPRYVTTTTLPPHATHPPLGHAALRYALHRLAPARAGELVMPRRGRDGEGHVLRPSQGRVQLYGRLRQRWAAHDRRHRQNCRVGAGSPRRHRRGRPRRSGRHAPRQPDQQRRQPKRQRLQHQHDGHGGRRVDLRERGGRWRRGGWGGGGGGGESAARAVQG